MIILLSLAGCDPMHIDECEWYLEPEGKHQNLVEKDEIAICARNFVIKRQKCYYSIEKEKIAEIDGKIFRLSHIKTATASFPRKIISANSCK